jgi:hypothetical protein
MVLAVHVIASVDVAAFVPVSGTITNTPLPYAILFQRVLLEVVLCVQVIPSVEVATEFVALPFATATNLLSAYIRLFQFFVAGIIVEFHVIPSVDDRAASEPYLTATKVELP